MRKLLAFVCGIMILLGALSGCNAGGGDSSNPPEKYQDYKNESGVGFFYPEEGGKLSGIAKVYGLAYTGEGWLEEDKGIGRVTVSFNGEHDLDARTYVKDRYWIRTFDTTQFKDGPLNIRVTAYDKKGAKLGSAANTVIIDNSKQRPQNRYYAAPEGKAENKGSKDSPWDIASAIKNLKPGDILFLRGGVYSENIKIKKSGTEADPITIMNYPGEKVELKGAGIDIEYKVEYVNLMGIDQSGLRTEDFGVNLADGVGHIQFWDCSFNDNTYPYETIKENTGLEWGTGFHSGIVGGIEGQNRQFITLSHCEAKYNDVDGFQLSSIDHGRFQFLESAWNPNHKTLNIFQYKHANGFVSKNSEYEHWGFPSEDDVYLFCYSHHNGQDGWDLRSPHNWLYGCVTHDEAQAGNNYGGLGMKFWEYDYKVYSCVNFRNNLIDGSGEGLLAGQYTYVNNTLFQHVRNMAVTVPEEADKVFSHNNIFADFVMDFSRPVKSYNSIFFGKGEVPVINVKSVSADPLLLNPDAGNFFLKNGSPALTAGDMKGFSFLVDGVDYSKLDALGRPRSSTHEVGPYTRFEGPDAAEYVKPAETDSSASSAPEAGSGEELEELKVPTAAISIDGNLQDWDGIEAYTFTKEQAGNPAKYPHTIALAWNGKDRLYVRGTIKQPEGKILADQTPDSSEWWNDDLFELFLIPELPADEAANRRTASHYALNSKGLFTAADLNKNATVQVLPLSGNEWSFEIEIPFEASMLEAVNHSHAVYGKFCTELNSAGEFSILGKTGEFWAPENYLKLKLENGG